MNIGYIGIGLMGRPCTLNLIKAGQTLFVWARRPEATVPVVEKGATLCASIVEVAARSEILFTNLSDTPDVESVLLGPGGVIEGGRPGLIVVDMSTISASATRRMARELAVKGITLVDAPVSGGTVGAENGTLTIMVGAEEADFQRIKPVLAAMGTSITRIGPSGAGQVAKSCNQIALTGAIAAVAEAVTFAQKSGLDFVPIREALLGGSASSSALKLQGQRMIDGNYAPGFKAALHLKDMNIVAGMAKEMGLTLPVSTEGIALLKALVAEGGADEDSAAMFKVVKKL